MGDSVHTVEFLLRHKGGIKEIGGRFREMSIHHRRVQLLRVASWISGGNVVGIVSRVGRWRSVGIHFLVGVRLSEEIIDAETAGFLDWGSWSRLAEHVVVMSRGGACLKMLREVLRGVNKNCSGSIAVAIGEELPGLLVFWLELFELAITEFESEELSLELLVFVSKSDDTLLEKEIVHSALFSASTSGLIVLLSLDPVRIVLIFVVDEVALAPAVARGFRLVVFNIHLHHCSVVFRLGFKSDIECELFSLRRFASR